MKQIRKPSTVWIIFWILLVSMAFMIIAGEWIISTAGTELRTRALNTAEEEIRYISEALYSQLTTIQMQNTEILNHESVLALAMQNSIMSSYETVSCKNTIIKLMRSRLSQLNIEASSRLYIPSVRTLITAQKASEIKEEELNNLLEIVHAFPDGLYCTEDQMGFWSASPLVRGSIPAENSRIMMTGIPQLSLKSLLRKYASPSGSTQLLLTLGNRIITSSHDTDWDDSVFIGTEEQVRTVVHDGSRYYAIRTWYAFSNLSVIAVLPVDYVMHSLYQLQRLLKALEIICILIVFLATAAFYRIVCSPLKRISARMQEVGSGDLSVRMAPEKTRELDYVGQTFNSMAEQLDQLIDREYKTRLLAANAEKKALQYQISPHFLYNTYFQLRNLILLEDREQAAQLADLMGRYLRYIVQSGETSATLREEMDHARNYADIQSMRFRGRIQVIYDITEGDWQNMTVPRLLVQPLIENAFSHGLKDMETGGMIRIVLQPDNGAVIIMVEDNGQSLSDADLEALRRSVTENSSGTGDSIALTNIHRRLQLYFGTRSGLQFSRACCGGLKVTVRMERNGHAEESEPINRKEGEMYGKNPAGG